jgi:hypothetical protein
MREWNRFVEIFHSSFSTFCRIFEIFSYFFASLCRVFVTFSSLFSKFDRVFEIVHSYSSKFLTFFRLEIFHALFLKLLTTFQLEIFHAFCQKLLTSFRLEIFHAFFSELLTSFQFEIFHAFFSELRASFRLEIFHAFFSEAFDVFSTRDFSRFFLRNCDVWSKWKSERRDIKEMRACLMIVLDRMSIEWVFERQQETFFCFLEEIIDSHDSIFLFEQTVVSFVVRFKSFWVKARKEEKDEFIIDKNVFKDSIWVRINIHRKCIRWYASSLECFHARAQSNLHWTSLTINQNEFFEMNYRDELSKNFSEWIIEGFFRVNYREKFFVEFTLTEILNLKSLATLTRFY